MVGLDWQGEFGPMRLAQTDRMKVMIRPSSPRACRHREEYPPVRLSTPVTISEVHISQQQRGEPFSIRRHQCRPSEYEGVHKYRAHSSVLP